MKAGDTVWLKTYERGPFLVEALTGDDESGPRHARLLDPDGGFPAGRFAGDGTWRRVPLELLTAEPPPEPEPSPWTPARIAQVVAGVAAALSAIAAIVVARSA